MGALHGLENVMTDLKGLVKPLAWDIYRNGNGYRQYRSGPYEITSNCLSYKDATGSFAVGGKKHPTLEAAKAAANADYEARILAAIDLATVEALVGALVEIAYFDDSFGNWKDACKFRQRTARAALASMKGTDT
jgi:hypothetical protein